MKAILISDHAKWCALMMNGDKTIEIRKGTALYKAIQKLIDENGYADIYVYCTKGSPYLAKPKESERYLLFTKGAIKLIKEQPLNGKVIFKFRCYKVEELSIKYGVGWQTKTIKGKEQVEKLTRLSVFQLFEYCGRKTSTAIHISDLEIFDKPKELSELYKIGKMQSYKDCQHLLSKNDEKYYKLTKAPQSFTYIEV